MSYIPDSIKLKSENERKSFVATVIIFSLLLLLLIWIKLGTTVKEKYEGGILIDFGTTETGQGEDNSSLGEPAKGETEAPAPSEPTPVKPTPTPPPTPTPTKQPVLTQNNEEIALAKQKKEQEKLRKEEEIRQKKIQEEIAKQKAIAEAERLRKEEEARKLKERLDKGFKGPKGGGSGGTASGGGEGQSTPGGNQGDPNGIPRAPKGDGTPGTGDGKDKVSFDLKGRKLLSPPPVDDQSQKRGTIKIRIKVDKSGRVVEAEFQQSGSNTTDIYLINISKQAAMKAKFNADPNAAEEQFGTITFNYVVN